MVRRSVVFDIVCVVLAMRVAFDIWVVIFDRFRVVIVINVVVAFEVIFVELVVKIVVAFDTRVVV